MTGEHPARAKVWRCRCRRWGAFVMARRGTVVGVAVRKQVAVVLAVTVGVYAVQIRRTAVVATGCHRGGRRRRGEVHELNRSGNQCTGGGSDFGGRRRGMLLCRQMRRLQDARGRQVMYVL